MQFERVAALAELASAPGRRLVVRLPSSNRAVLLLALGGGADADAAGGVVALDEFCYHHGGPLSGGDVEELPGGRCVVLCPWHKYRIDVRGGDCVYVGVDPATGATAWKSKGVKQRTHPVDVRADGSVWVADSSRAAAAGGGGGGDGGGAPPPRVESDAYAFLQVAPPQPRDAAAGRLGGDARVSVPLHSRFCAPPPPDAA